MTKTEAWVIKRDDGKYYFNGFWWHNLEFAEIFRTQQQAHDWIEANGLCEYGHCCYPQKVEIREITSENM